MDTEGSPPSQGDGSGVRSSYRRVRLRATTAAVAEEQEAVTITVKREEEEEEKEDREGVANDTVVMVRKKRVCTVHSTYCTRIGDQGELVFPIFLGHDPLYYCSTVNYEYYVRKRAVPFRIN